MKLETWTCGTLAGLIATIVLKIITVTLDYFDVLSISEIEYAARFILHLPGQELATFDWIIGLITNFSLGVLFGVLSAYLFKYTGKEEKYLKMLGIAFILWFFHLVIVPFLDPTIQELSTAQTAFEFYLNYLLWSFIAGFIILKYLKVQPKRQTSMQEQNS